MMLRHLRGMPTRRLRRAERCFFDAYCYGGWSEPGELVIPIGYFARAGVERTLRLWLVDGEVLDLDALEAEWRAALPPGVAHDGGLFYKNFASFLALFDAHPCRSHRGPLPAVWNPPGAVEAARMRRGSR